MALARRHEGAAGSMPLQQIRVTPKGKLKSAGDATKPHQHQQQQPPPCADPSPPRMEQRRPSSQPSTVGGSSTLGGDICRICHCEGDAELPLISPCYCSGSLRWVHQSCLQQWIKSSDTRCCELCKFQFIMHTKIKPFRKWEKLEMSSVERRKVACSMAFHAVAVTCVVWSLYVLIERTAEEVRAGALEWPFWTKLVVVAVGFAGGLVFMYVQCRMYVQLFRRWRAYNRIICVQNAPEKQPTSQAVFSAAAQLTASVLASSEEKRMSPDEDEFHSCQSGTSSSSGTSPAQSSDSVNEATPLDQAAPPGLMAAETGSTKTTLTSVTDSLPVVHQQGTTEYHPLGEVVVVVPGDPCPGEGRAAS